MSALATAVAPAPSSRTGHRRSLRVAGLFAGIGGIEVGLGAARHRAELLCEIEPAAQSVLRARFPTVELVGDVCDIRALPPVDLVTAGFPCQDLSQAGRTVGIGGTRSGLVGQVFRLLEDADPTWLMLENVPFMLQLERGRAMAHLTAELARLGFRWAYRVVDARAFGVPQRRRRVILLASRRQDPCDVLFADEAGAPDEPDFRGLANGFYWTEGLRGLGWAVDAVPTLKGGSTIGIPSAPAVWTAAGLFGTPDIRDAERLQGFDAGWTDVWEQPQRRDLAARWKMVGNAVCAPVAEWVGGRLAEPGRYDHLSDGALVPGRTWPTAAWGDGDVAHRVGLSEWPVQLPRPHLHEFLRHPLHPLSTRASLGFLGRAQRAQLRFPEGLLEGLRTHAAMMSESAA